ncbi:cathepsin G isoform X1 [Drosophila sechellia]|uniref:GM14686 n=1 Tax=Drosophila sechellia TaxID=7238 RepID=B4HXJ8_DROSE|nr:cathepsin G isoform X1 [Drosophila sechellia]EDW51778.1 GM14686 [Drosophila sechellia]
MHTAVIGVPAFVGIILMFQLLHPGCSQFLDPACGIRTQSRTAHRIINGHTAKYNSSPWMVFLHSTTDMFVCGGSLITNKLVLTAAHCFIANQHLVARLGEYERTRSEECIGYYCNFREEHMVDAGFKHKLYDPNTHANDIAILRLAKSVVYRDNIRPICVVWDHKWRQYIDKIDLLTATGWGKTEMESDSDALQTLDIRRQPPEVCARFIGQTIAGNQFCAGNWDSNLCNGDSGGPLGAMITHKNTQRFLQIGIASYTNRNCQKASVFTDVLSNAEFILRVWRMYGKGQRLPIPKRPTPTTRPPTWWHTPKQTFQDYDYDTNHGSHWDWNYSPEWYPGGYFYISTW